MTRPLKMIALGIAAALASSLLVSSANASAAAKPITDKKATVTVTPYDGVTAGKVTATFTKAQIKEGRPVQLQRLASGQWVDDGEPVAMNAKGTATFTFDPPSYSSPSQTVSYRAVAGLIPEDTTFQTQAITPAAKSARLIDQSSTWSYHPVAEGSFGSLKFTFAKAHRTKNRPVQLQVLRSGTWSKVGKPVKMSSSGVAIFKDVFTTATDSGQTYRAVAAKYKKKLEAVTVPATPTAASPWTSVRDYSFGTDAESNGEWSTWDDGSYGVRKCSANRAGNTTMKGGYATLVVKDTTKTDLGKARAAGCPKKLKYSYSNGMVSTVGKFTIKNGIVAARVKFSKNRFMHGGIWLASNDEATEIDIIESYGYAGAKSKYSKTTSGIHQRLKSAQNKALKTPKGWEKTYKDGMSQTVFHTRKLSSSWFSKYHVVSVEFTAAKMTFRVDGKVTRTLTRTTPESDYFLVMSMLTTQWELEQAPKGKLKTPAEMKVDWVRVWQKA